MMISKTLGQLSSGVILDVRVENAAMVDERKRIVESLSALCTLGGY